MKSKICLVLTESTIKKNLELIEQYRNWIDLAELRVDCLAQNEQLYLRRLPSEACVPIILTIRRNRDGGNFVQGEGKRTMLLAQGLANANTKPSDNFSAVDIECDMSIPILEEAARAVGITLIHSVHDFSGDQNKFFARNRTFLNESINSAPDDQELYKFAYHVSSLAEATVLLKEKKIPAKKKRIIIAMGKYGFALRILAAKFGDPIIYTVADSDSTQVQIQHGMVDPITLHRRYNIRSVNEETVVFGLIGRDVAGSKSPDLHNAWFNQKKMNAVYVPISAASISEAMDFVKEVPMRGISITAPFKSEALHYADCLSEEATAVGAINTLIYDQGKWCGHNTDVTGFEQSLVECLETSTLNGKKISIIGAGGAGRAVAYTVKKLGAVACIFNRSRPAAVKLAEQYGFEYCILSTRYEEHLNEFSDIIIQASSVGEEPEINADPVPFYNFKGTELVFDIIYRPQKTAFLTRAAAAGCKVSNGASMLHYQGLLQANLFEKIIHQH